MPNHTPHLLNDLHTARANGAHMRVLNRILHCDLLVPDDFGLQVLPPQAVQGLYEIITERYERGSLIVTSSRAFDEWVEVCNNDLLASAVMDLLTYHAHTLTICGDSFRRHHRRKEVPPPLTE